MRSFTAILIAVTALGGCSTAPPSGGTEDFGAAFKRMQADPEFLAARAHPRLRIVEELSQDGGAAGLTRVIPCSIRDLHAAGWHVLPGPDRLAETGTTYSPPEFSGPHAVAVTLGPAASTADARYFFQAAGGTWKLARVEVYSDLEPGAPLPPLPCSRRR